MQSQLTNKYFKLTRSSKPVILYHIRPAGGRPGFESRSRQTQVVKKIRVSSSTNCSATSVNIHGPPDEIIKPNKRTFTAQWSPASLAEANNEMYHKIVPTTYRDRVVSNMNFI